MALRLPRSTAPAIAAGPAATPPDASTPMSANCDPPENISRLSTQVCQISRPAVTPSAPNEMPYADTASPTLTACRMATVSSALRAIRSNPHRSCQVRSVPVGVCDGAKRREARGDREADPRHHLRMEDTAEQLRPLPHLSDPGTARGCSQCRGIVLRGVTANTRDLIRIAASATGRSPNAVVVDQHSYALVTPPEGDRDGCSLTAVLEGVGQGLLEDAIDGQLRTGVEGKPLTGLFEVDLEAGLAHDAEQLACCLDCWLAARIRFGVLNDVCHPTQVGEGRSGGFRDPNR